MSPKPPTDVPVRAVYTATYIRGNDFQDVCATISHDLANTDGGDRVRVPGWRVMALDRERLVQRLDVRAVRERLVDLYARATPSSGVTEGEASDGSGSSGDAVQAEFDFAAWLEASHTSGPSKPPAESRLVTDVAVGTTESVDADYGEFAFAEWLASSDSFEPTAAPAVESDGIPSVESVGSSSDRRGVPRPSVTVHPAKAATYALFFTVVVLAALSMMGYLPVLGPADGLAV